MGKERDGRRCDRDRCHFGDESRGYPAKKFACKGNKSLMLRRIKSVDGNDTINFLGTFVYVV